jgi:hypothetical protein
MLEFQDVCALGRLFDLQVLAVVIGRGQRREGLNRR